MGTVALEFVPPSVADGAAKAREEAQKVARLAKESGIDDRLSHLMIPGLIEEESDRPVELKQKMDPKDVYEAVKPDLPLKCIVTQVTAFDGMDALEARVDELQSAGIERIVFVGVPRTMADGEGPGVSPIDALGHFKGKVDQRGVILIPTREGETGRFGFKLDSGANFALCQLLYSDYITKFLPTMQEKEHRPEILLSFGHVPQAEQRVGLIRWLIQDENPLVQKEMQYVEELAGMSHEQRKQSLVDLYKRVVDGVKDLGFPIGLHLECPYGFSEKAFDTFHALLDVWSPDDQ